MSLLGWDNEHAARALLEAEEIEEMRLRCLAVGCTIDRWTLALQIAVDEAQRSPESSHEVIMRKLHTLYACFMTGELP